MKFQQYLTEKAYTKTEFEEVINKMNGEGFDLSKQDMQNFDNMLKDIKKSCKHIIKIYQKTYNENMYTDGAYLYRGMRGVNDNFDKITALKNREPKDTNKWIHNLLDDNFEELFDARPRSSGTFCSGSRGMAENYGNYVYVIFPTDKFDFIWSKTVKDLYVSAQGGKAERYMEDKKNIDGLKYTFDEFEQYMSSGKTDNKVLEKTYNDYLQHLIEKDYIFNGNLIEALQNGNEIMVVCDKYFAIKADMVKHFLPLIIK